MELVRNEEKRAEYTKRAKELVSKMTLEEKVQQTLYQAPAIERLGIKAYNWWNEALMVWQELEWLLYFHRRSDLLLRSMRIWQRKWQKQYPRKDVQNSICSRNMTIRIFIRD